MSSDHPPGQKSGFWTSMNGVVTAIAGLLTAAAGLLVALYQVGVIGGDDSEAAEQPAALVSISSTPTPTPTEAETGDTPGDLLAGTWKGQATGTDEGGVFDVELTLEPSCALRQPCGTIYVSVGCEGRVRLWTVQGSTYQFYVDHFTNDSADFCTPGAGDFFELVDDSHLRYYRDYNDATGTLERT